jgi:hypothetical protein
MLPTLHRAKSIDRKKNPSVCEIFLSRFGGKQIEAYEDTGLVNYALVRDAAEEEARLEQFGRELEAE